MASYTIGEGNVTLGEISPWPSGALHEIFCRLMTPGQERNGTPDTRASALVIGAANGDPPNTPNRHFALKLEETTTQAE